MYHSFPLSMSQESCHRGCERGNRRRRQCWRIWPMNKKTYQKRKFSDKSCDTRYTKNFFFLFQHWYRPGNKLTPTKTFASSSLLFFFPPPTVCNRTGKLKLPPPPPLSSIYQKAEEERESGAFLLSSCPCNSNEQEAFSHACSNTVGGVRKEQEEERKTGAKGRYASGGKVYS